jgi:hypothetical protein
MSWTKCMQNKIEGHYGTAAKDCAKGIKKGNFLDIVKCLVVALGVSNPEIWIPEQVALFGVWSVACIFSDEDGDEYRKTNAPAPLGL